jgi:hypothetical protein
MERAGLTDDRVARLKTSDSRPYVPRSAHTMVADGGFRRAVLGGDHTNAGKRPAQMIVVAVYRGTMVTGADMAPRPTRFLALTRKA